MDEALTGQDESSATYIDDVVFSETWEEHLDHARVVLEALKKAGMMAIPGKCIWCTQTVTYLGHEVGGEAKKLVFLP